MTDSDRRFWPFRPIMSIAAAILILLGLLLIVAILRANVSWPSQNSETVVLIGVLLFSVLPVLLALVDVIIERGGVIEYKGIKIDFSQVPKTGVSGFTVPVNIGVPGQSISDSSTTEILDTLREAMDSDLVIIDLEKGQAWWETRLLVLLAGAVRLKKPEKMVFVGTDGGVGKCFQGWGYASELLPYLLQAHPQYLRSYHTAMAAARQWELVEPVNPANPANPGLAPPQPSWIQGGLAQRHQWMAFENKTGLPNALLAEQLLASELGERVEEAEEPPKRISLVRLEDLFRPILHKECVEETLSTEEQMKAFFQNDTPYIAITQNGTYTSLVSRMSVLNAIVKTLIEKNKNVSM